MCGRFTLRTPAHLVAETFRLDDVPLLKPRYNIAPTQPVAAVRLRRSDTSDGSRELVMLRWGLIPFWAEDAKVGYRMINARAETVAKKPAFRQAFARRRCLIVSDGFYEWRKTNGTKQPYFIHLKDDRPFAFAGLWERWKGDAEPIESCTIIVTDANDLLLPIHDRMPVILSPDQYDLWLDPEFGDAKKLEQMLRPYEGDDLQAYAVSTVVNNPKNDVPTCVEPLERE